MNAMTVIGNAMILGYLGLWLAWAIVENRRDWFIDPRRATRYVAMGMTVVGAFSVAIHFTGSQIYPDAFWWSTPLLAFLSSFILGIARPSVGINTAYRFLTVAAPAALFLGAMFFLLLFAGQVGGCLMGFRFGEAIGKFCRWVTTKTRSPNQTSCATSEPALSADSSSPQG